MTTANHLTQKNVLILTSDSGFGHRSAANSIIKALEYQFHNQVHAYTINPFMNEQAPFIFRKSEVEYDNTVTKNKTMYRFTYKLSNTRSATTLLEHTSALMLQKNIIQIINTTQPHVILATNQWFNTPTYTALNKLKYSSPFFTVVTDLSDLHKLWFSSKPDRYFVASENVLREAAACDVDPSKVVVSGIPVDPAFKLNTLSKKELRQSLNIEPELPLILFVGSKRVKNIEKCLEVLSAMPGKFQAVAIAGGDDDLYFRLTHKMWNFPLHIYNYVNNIPEWILAADMIATKAGGLILSESMAAGQPMVLIDYLPGQEEGNVKYVQDEHAGVLANHEDLFRETVHHWLHNEQIMESFAKNSLRCGHADSAFIIASHVMDKILSCTKTETKNIHHPYIEYANHLS